MKDTYIVYGHAYDREGVLLCIDGSASASAAVAEFKRRVREQEGARREVIIEVVARVPSEAGALVCDGEDATRRQGCYFAIGHMDDREPSFRILNATSPDEAGDLMVRELQAMAEDQGRNCDCWLDGVVFTGGHLAEYILRW